MLKGARAYEQAHFEAAVQVSVQTARKRIRAQSLVTARAITLVFGAITLVLWSGAHDVIAGRMSAGTLAQFVLYALIGGGWSVRWPRCGTSCSARPASMYIGELPDDQRTCARQPSRCRCRARCAGRCSSTTSFRYQPVRTPGGV